MKIMNAITLLMILGIFLPLAGMFSMNVYGWPGELKYVMVPFYACMWSALLLALFSFALSK